MKRGVPWKHSERRKRMPEGEACIPESDGATNGKLRHLQQRQSGDSSRSHRRVG